jgi:hypothetical protein
VERNFLGTGGRIGVTYRVEPNRSAVTLRGGLDRVGGTRFGFEGFYDDLSDGQVGVWRFGLPFRAFRDPAGFELMGQARRQRALQFRDGDLINVYQRRLTMQGAWIGVATFAGADRYLRLGVAGHVKREEYVEQSFVGSAVPDTVSGTFGPFVDFAAARFKVVNHYDGFARDVDIDLSTRIRLTVFIAPDAFGYRSTGVGPRIEAQSGLSVGRSFAKIQVRASGLFNSAGLDSGQVWAGATIAARILPRHATVFHIEGARRRGTPPGQEYALGHGNGPRAFGPNAFTGDAMVWGSLEHRAFLLDEVFGLLGIGLAAFVDYGGAWFRGPSAASGSLAVPAEPARLGGNVGLGLRLGATRSTGQNVGRFDVAYRFGDGIRDGKRWVVSFGRGFAF